MENKNIVTIILLFAILIVGAILVSKQTEEPMGGGFDYVTITEGIIHTTVSVNQYVPTLVLATSTSRIDALFCDVDTNNVIYLNFINSITSIDMYEGYHLQAGKCGRLTDILGYRYSGPIYGLASSTTSTLSVTSK